MTKKDFLLALNDALGSMTGDERSAAIKYYSDYIDDAGIENLDAVLAELGSPQEVAASIMAEAQPQPQQAAQGGAMPPPPAPMPRQGMPTWAVVLLICVLFPVWMPVLGALAGLAAGLFAVLVGFFAAALALLVGGLIMLVLGVINVVTLPPVGLLVIGVGCILISIGMVLAIGCVFLCRTVLPAMVHGIGRFCRMIFRRNESGAAGTQLH